LKFDTKLDQIKRNIVFLKYNEPSHKGTTPM